MDFIMRVSVLLICFVFSVNVGVSMEKAPQHVVYVEQIIKAFTKEMERNVNFHAIGDGGSMPSVVNSVYVQFQIFHRATIEEARLLEVFAVERLTEMINAHEKIRPYLCEFPFPSSRVEIGLTFCLPSGLSFADGTVASVMQTRGNIRYSFTDPDSGSLVSLLKEPYLEAKKTVDASANIKTLAHHEKPHEALIDIIFAAYQKEMWNDYELEIERIGGKLVDRVEEVSVRLIYFNPTYIEKARELQIIATERMLHLINNDKQLRPYVNDFPLTIDKLKVAVIFRRKNYCPYFDGSLESVSRVGKEITYFIEQKREPIGKTQIIRAERPVFAKESYQEALNTTEGSRALEKTQVKCCLK
jgi:hypothetical protein